MVALGLLFGEPESVNFCCRWDDKVDFEGVPEPPVCWVLDDFGGGGGGGGGGGSAAVGGEDDWFGDVELLDDDARWP